MNGPFTSSNPSRPTSWLPWMTALSRPLLPVRGCLGVLGIWLGLACLSVPCLAQTTWTGTTNTDWATPGNWNTGLVPTASSDVVIADAANDPIIGAGTAALANSVEVQPGAVLSLVNTATMTINGSKTFSTGSSAFINQGTVTNSGQLIMGNLASVGDYGLYNVGAFNNNTGGTISIDRSTFIGLLNNTGSTFTNAASIVIGATVSVGQFGIYNVGTFNNNTGGTISIDRSTVAGLFNLYNYDRSTFTNAASIVIGATASAGEYGLVNQTTFHNNTGGTISIDRSTNAGILNNGEDTFTNAASIIIGATASVGSYGLYNEATFANNACATLALYASLANAGSFTNDGLFTLNTTQAHTNSALTNNGILSYPQGNPIPNVTNNELIVVPISTSCQLTATPALQIGGLSSFSVGSTWFKDAGLTTPVGTYNANVFTASNLAAGGTYPVYFSVSDPVNGCVRTVSIALTVNSLPTASITASANPVTAGQSVTLTASGGTQYVWSTGATTATITVQPSVTTLYSVTVTNAAGCSSPASVSITVLSGSISTFTDIGANLTGVLYSSVAWGDYDNDGDLDFLLTGITNASSTGVSMTQLYRNDQGSFTLINANLPAVYGSSVAWGDYDNDGDLDILLSGSNITRVYRNDQGSFTLINANLPAVYGSSVAWGDYDNDGDLDILLSGYNNGSGIISRVYRNDQGSFTDLNAGLTGVYNGSVAWGDYDNDGDLDILLAGTTNGNNSGAITRIYRNDQGSFSDINAGLTGMLYGSVAWGDYDNDGDLDILLSGDSGGFVGISRVYRNDQGSFIDLNAGLTGAILGSVAWGDYDNDGDLDILLTGDSSGGPISRVYRNDNGSFTDINANLPGLNGSSVAWGDYDNDGDLDVLLTGRTDSGSISRIYRNDGSVFNTAPTAPTGLSASLSGQDVTLTWNPATDTKTPAKGLSYNLYLGTSPQSVDKVSPQSQLSNGYRKIVALGNGQTGTSFKLKNLPAGTYYWSVQAVDAAFAGSPFATQAHFSTNTSTSVATASTTYGSTAVNLVADVTPVPSGGSVEFFLQDYPSTGTNTSLGTASKGADGHFTLAYNPSALSVGDYTILAVYSGLSSYPASNGSGTLTVSSLPNHPPVVAHAIPNQTAKVNAPFSFSFAANTFSDSDGNPLTYSAVLSGNAALPAWLSFQANTRTFSGTPPSTSGSPFTIQVTASDGSLSVSTPFTLTVNPASVGPQVVSFTLVNADTDQDIQPIADGATLNLASLPTQHLNIRANTTPTKVDKVVFNLSGKQSRTATEVEVPYALFGDTKGNYDAWVPAVGSYSLKATPFSTTAGTALTIAFSVINQNTTNHPPVVAHSIPNQTATVNAPLSFSFAANTFSDPDANALTYSASLSDNTSLPAWLSFQATTRTFSGTPPNITGSPFTIRVTASDGSLQTSTTFTLTVNPVSVGSQVVSFTLVNADTDQDIQPLANGATLNLASLPTRNLNIRANTTPTQVDKVVFNLSGKQSRTVTEGGAPYALFGDKNGDYNAWVPAVGSYTLKATPFSTTAGTALTLSFSVINQAARLAVGEVAAVAMQLVAYPNPTTDGQVKILLSQEMIGEVSFVLVYQTGVMMTRGQVVLKAPSSVLSFDFSGQMRAAGVYYLRLEGGQLKGMLKLQRQ